LYVPSSPGNKQSPWISKRSTNVKASRGNDIFLKDHKWRKCRNAFIAANPLCVQCLKKGKTTAGKEVDHINPRIPNTFNPSYYDWNGLQTLCSHHHAIKSNGERKHISGGRGV